VHTLQDGCEVFNMGGNLIKTGCNAAEGIEAETISIFNVEVLVRGHDVEGLGTEELDLGANFVEGFFIVGTREVSEDANVARGERLCDVFLV